MARNTSELVLIVSGANLRQVAFSCGALVEAEAQRRIFCSS
jgi:hypothetical protein